MVRGCYITTKNRQYNQHTEIDDELSDLHAGDVLLPPGLDAAGSEEVIPVHDNVNGQVERNDNPRDRRPAKHLGEAEQSGSTMVVGVKES